MKIELLSLRECASWLEQQSNDLPFVFSPAYLSAVEQWQKRTAYIVKAGESIMPFLSFRSQFLKMGQLLFPPLRAGKRLSATEELDVLTLFLGDVGTTRLVDRMVHSPVFAIFQSAPTRSASCPFGTYYLDLTETEDHLWSRMHGKHRNVIVSSKRKGVTLQFDDNQLEPFHHLYAATMERGEMDYEPYSWFRELQIALGRERFVCGMVYDGETPLGGLCMPFTPYGAYYLYGASSENVNVTGALNYLHWETIRMLKQKGVKRYDFVGARLNDVTGTKLEGIQRFKERFGASLEKGFLWKMDLRPRKAAIYDCLLACSFQLRGKNVKREDIIDQEIAKLQ